MTKKRRKKQLVWVYVDKDHGDIEVFSTEKAARRHAEACWTNEEEGWRGNKLGDYVTIHECEVD